MMKIPSRILLFALMLTSLSYCKSGDTKKTRSDKLAVETPATAAPDVIIYKTKKDYSKNVPIILSENKDEILVYPAPGDLYYKGDLAYPTPLENGYLMDNRGINENVAFLDYTYEEYSKMKKTPRREDLWAHIIDKNPLEEMYKCGNKTDYDNIRMELNHKIEAGELKNCQQLK
ncbi:MAG: hypothetical protein K9G67_11700 [Bacteroidales bacterium]|nr:hypothetical protein [Bacteroidales bacterium]MCF8344997.1 hypothetical protein [Bacteroidales bacterium]MCF8351710.1 hypothetical protein [Bacteroidales bacterium]MCF8377012.1 hypothetical protein [Bacteroidales bacterium]MCF8400909.1 hypothetical protein [Bacteroidales bacterium]